MTDQDWEWVELRAAELIAHQEAWQETIIRWTNEENSGAKSWLYGAEPYYWTREHYAGYLAAAAIYG